MVVLSVSMIRRMLRVYLLAVLAFIIPLFFHLFLSLEKIKILLIFVVLLLSADELKGKGLHILL